MKSGDIHAAIRPVIRTFQRLAIPYYIGGSVASSALGIARTTLDVDLVADIHATHVGSLAVALRDHYYVDEEMVQAAIATRSSFNLVHLETMIKVDVFIPKDEPFHREAFARRRLDRLDEEDEVFICTAEDVILHKLLWYERGGRVSERQWNDLVGVMRVQSHNLDRPYLTRWATDLKLAELLQQALDEAGLR